MMRPLAELVAPGLRGIFTDVDDTLTHAGVLVPAAYAAIARAREAGLRVVPVTGRPAGWADVMAATWPVDAVIAENGALWAARDRDLQFWESPEKRAENGPKLEMLRAQTLAELPYARVSRDQWLRRADLTFDIGETQHLDDAQIAAIVARIHAAGARALVSSVHAHALFGGWDKDKMLLRLAAELWGEDLTREEARRGYIYIGDSLNDQSGFAAFPLSVGVANVARYVPRLSPPPAFVTPSPGGHGFAELVDQLLR